MDSNATGHSVTRDFTVATFVVEGDRVLLLFHRKLHMWLPPGGHIERDELPDRAALREVLEETGIAATLLPERAVAAPGPVPLARPEGVQLEDIGPNHQHIDLIYFATPVGPLVVRENPQEGSAAGWYRLDELAGMGVTEEVHSWARRAVRQVQERLGDRQSEKLSPE